MKQFRALLRLELSQWKISLSMAGGRKEKKDRSVTRMLSVLALVSIVAVYMVFLELKVMDILQVLETNMGVAGATKLLPKLLVTFSMVLTFMMGLFQVISSLYFSRDIAILGYLPVKSRIAYAARLCGSLVQEIFISLIFILPGTIIYFIRMGFDGGMLARALVVTVFSPVIPLCLAALLAGVLTKLPGFWRHREIVTTAFSIIVILATLFMSFSLSNLQNSSEDQEKFTNAIKMLTDGMDGVTMSVPLVRWFSAGLVDGGMNLVWGVLGACGAFALVCWLFGGNYLPVASQALENTGVRKKVDLGKERIRGASPMKALILREIREMVRTPAYLTNGLLMSLIMPTVMVGILLFTVSNSTEGGLRALMEQSSHPLTNLLAALVVTCLMSLMMGMNATAATGVSREGKRHALMRSLPVSSRMILMSKLLTAVFFQVIGIIPAVVMIGIMLPGFWLYALMVLVWGSLLAFVGACLGLIIDVTRPKMDWINETQAIKSGANQLLSLLAYILILGLIAVGTVFAVDMPFFTPPVFCAILTGILALLALGCYIWVGHMVKAYDRIGE